MARRGHVAALAVGTRLVGTTGRPATGPDPAVRSEGPR